MDQAAALLMALRAKAALGNGKVEPAQAETLAAEFGFTREKLPALATQWQKAGQVAIAWGGILEVLPEPSDKASVVINAQGAIFGPGATIAGRDATGATVTITPEAAFGALAAVLLQLREIRPGLQGEAAVAADAVTQTIETRPAATASDETRRSWAGQLGNGLSRLLQAAPQAKALAELGEKVAKGFGWV